MLKIFIIIVLIGAVAMLSRPRPVLTFGVGLLLIPGIALALFGLFFLSFAYIVVASVVICCVTFLYVLIKSLIN